VKGAKVQRCKGAKVQRCKGAKVQGAGCRVQRCRVQGAGAPVRINLSAEAESRLALFWQAREE